MNEEVETTANLGSTRTGECQNWGQRSRKAGWRPFSTPWLSWEVPMATSSAMAVVTRQTASSLIQTLDTRSWYLPQVHRSKAPAITATLSRKSI